MFLQKATKQNRTEKYGIRIRFTGSTTTGLVREHNEDNFAIVNLTDGNRYPPNSSCVDYVYEGGSLFVVCDGMGGAAAGEIASKIALESICQSMFRGQVTESRDALPQRLVEAVEEASRRVYDVACKDDSKRGMGTTLTAGVLIGRTMFLAQVGDSRAYLLRKGVLKQLTKDQTLVNQLVETGVIDKKEAMNHARANIILQALGTSDKVLVDLTSVDLCNGDRLLMCSDGLCGLVVEDYIRRILTEYRNPLNCCMRLIGVANENGGDDNITVIVTDFDGTALDEPTDEDSFGYLPYQLSCRSKPLNRTDTADTVRPPRRSKKAATTEISETPSSNPVLPRIIGSLSTLFFLVTILSSSVYYFVPPQWKRDARQQVLSVFGKSVRFSEAKKQKTKWIPKLNRQYIEEQKFTKENYTIRATQKAASDIISDTNGNGNRHAPEDDCLSEQQVEMHSEIIESSSDSKSNDTVSSTQLSQTKEPSSKKGQEDDTQMGVAESHATSELTSKNSTNSNIENKKTFIVQEAEASNKINEHERHRASLHKKKEQRPSAAFSTGQNPYTTISTDHDLDENSKSIGSNSPKHVVPDNPY